jgi:hypothetical protein
MRRDMELVRQILMNLEERADSHGNQCVDLQIEGRSATEVSYHVMLLTESGLIEARDASDGEGLEWWPMRLTWEGHEFLEKAKQDGLWQTAKKMVVERGASLSFDVLKAALTKLAMDSLVGG